jgi:hypothetical protein
MIVLSDDPEGRVGVAYDAHCVVPSNVKYPEVPDVYVGELFKVTEFRLLLLTSTHDVPEPI